MFKLTTHTPATGSYRSDVASDLRGGPLDANSGLLSDLGKALIATYAAMAHGSSRENVPRSGDLPHTRFEPDKSHPGRAGIVFADPNRPPCVIESSPEEIQKLSMKAAQYAALAEQNGDMDRHGATYVPRDKKKKSSTSHLISRMTSRHYHLHCADGYRRKKEEIGAGVWGKIRTAFLPRNRHHASANLAVKKYGFPHKRYRLEDPMLCARSAEHEFAIYKALGKSEHVPEVMDVLHAIKNGELRSYLLMEKMEGMDLEQVLDKMNENPPSPEEAVAIIQKLARQCLETLQWMHQRSVVHGDIKATNFFCQTSGKVKVFDMGMAQAYPAGEDIFAHATNDYRWLADIFDGGWGYVSFTNVLSNYEDDPAACEAVDALHDIAGMLRGQTGRMDALLQHPYFQIGATQS